MAKDPALLFYTSDFLMSTLCLSMEDRGKYITILCLMHQQGRLTLEEMQTALHCDISVNILNKFKKDEFDKFYSERLEQEKEKRAAFVKSRKNSADINNGDMVHIYLIKDPNKELYKIGSSKYPYLRIKEVVKYKPGADFYWISPTLTERKLEKELHDKYVIKKERYDWFFLDSKDLEDIKNLFRISSERCRTVNENENENRNETVLEKGVQGEKPFEETLWTTVSRNFINDFIWKEKFCRDKNFPIAELEKLLKIFIADIDLKHDYKPLKELQSHFVNWFNKNKYADSKVRNRVDDLHEYARRHD